MANSFKRRVIQLVKPTRSKPDPKTPTENKLAAAQERLDSVGKDTYVNPSGETVVVMSPTIKYATDTSTYSIKDY